MVVKVSDIMDDGMELCCEKSPEALGLVDSDAGFEGSIKTQVRLFRVEDTVTVSGTVQAMMTLECGRCTKPFPFSMRLPFETAFSPMPVSPESSKKDYELSQEELGLYFYSGPTIDLGEYVREQVLLALPMVPLCGTECRGLCLICGQDRNIGACDCIQEEEYGSSKT